MKNILFLFIVIKLLFGIEYSKNEQQFLKDNPVIYISAMDYWSVDKKGESFHTNYMKLINKYGHLNLQPVYYKYWSDGFTDAKNGITFGIMALSYSNERKKYFYYTKPYNYTPYYLLVNKHSDINSLKDLKNKKVYIAENSILREVLKNKNLNIINTKHSYKKLAQGKIDAILLFYVPDTKYLDNFKIIKTFIDKNGEEYIGISKKYPQLYSIISKVMQTIPYSEIEKIRAIAYEKRVSKIDILKPELEFKDFIRIQDILLIFLLVFGLFLILYFLLSKKFLNLKIKNFLLIIFLFDITILGFIVYEILIFNYYSKKVLEIKSKSFASLYLADDIEKSVANLSNCFRNEKYHKNNKLSALFENNYMNSSNLLIDNKPLKNLLNTRYFTTTELSHLAYIKNLLDKLIILQNQILDKKVDISIYVHNKMYLLNEFQKLRNVIKNENENEIFIIQQKLKYQFILLLFSILLFIFESIFVFVMMKKKIYNPISYFTNIIRDYKQGKDIYKKITYNDEIGEMIDEFFVLKEQLENTIKKLEKHKENLEKEVQKELDKRIYQEKILIKQSKLAMMGEMIDAIAHQWKQPLNSISLGIQLLELEKDNIDLRNLDMFIENANAQIHHLITTLDEFRTFFREDKEKESICMTLMIKKVLVLLKDDLMKNNIEVETHIDYDFCIDGIENEFQHILITLLSNAKDIFNQREIKKRKIIINTKKEEEFCYLEIIDNAGGVPEVIKEKIFELNFTTRENGTGVGLYLASQIAVKHLGVLEVENTQDGAKFYFKVRCDV